MPATHAPAVTATGLTVRYGPSGHVTAVDGIDLEADAGEVLVVLGPNGAGKTSTIEALEGYRRPSAGQLSVLGLDPVRDHHRLTQHMGVMLQDGGVYPMLGPRRALDLFAAYYPEPRSTEELLELVDLRTVATTPWRHLSGGEKQRLSLALALVGRPHVAFLDEPTAGVDPEGRLAIRTVVADLRAEGVCVLMTTHELDEAEKMADRIMILSGGRIVLQGTPRELAASGGSASVAFGAPTGLDTVSLATALGVGVTVREHAEGRYRVEGASGPGATAVLATWLAERQIELSDLVTGRTLEDVYFGAVGGAAARERAPTGAAGVAGRRRGRGRRDRRAGGADAGGVGGSGS